MFARFRLVWPALWVATCLILFPASRALGQSDDVKISKEQLEELKRKAAEADRLQEQLKQAQKEIEALKGSNTVVVPVVRDSNNRVVPIPAAVFQSIPQQPPTPPLADVPPVTEGSVVSVHDLLTYFETNPAAADARFRNKTFSVRGYVTDFRKPLFLSTYDVNFRLPGHELYLDCLFRPPEEYRGFYVSGSGEEMIGETYNARTVFARVGTELTVRGYCEGVSKGAVRMGGCQYMVVPRTAR